MRHPIFVLAGLAAALSGVGCAADGPAVEVVDEATLRSLGPDAALELDLTLPGQVYLVDLDERSRSRLVLVCPDGVRMAWDRWVAAAPDRPEALAGVFTLSPDADAAAEALEQEQPDCDNECARCDDGVTYCSAPPEECVSERARDAESSSSQWPTG